MTIEAGRNLLHYRLVEKIGEGGMGVVWKAVDTALDREVAIKILPDMFADNPERLARFEREAKLLAALNHPNIATVHGLHQAEGTRFLAMELVEGQDLTQSLAAASMPVHETLTIALHVAEALEAAHERGIVHRDLKPANIRITPEGKVKVLDFGLAKALSADPISGSSTSLSMSPTVTSAGTVAGVILGTAGYMSPEQAKGKPVDRRADIWAFGVLLTEMLSGVKMFDAETISEILAKVLMTPIEWDALPDETPAPIRRLLRRCLERDPRRRLRDIGEARVLLEDITSGATDGEDETAAAGAAPAAPAPRSPLRTWLPWAVALAAVVAAVVTIRQSAPRTDPPAGRIATSILVPPGSVFDVRNGMALSPDGAYIAFPARDSAGVRRLWIRELTRTTARVLDGTERALSPFWSPDSRQVAFFADDKVKKIDVVTGVIETIADSTYALGADWSHRGDIILSTAWGTGLQRIPASGGKGEYVVGTADPGAEAYMWPSFLPDEQHFIYLARLYGSEEATGEVRLGSLDGSTNRTLLKTNSNAVYAEPGYLLWWHDGNLRAQRFDTERLELVGDAIPLIPDVRFSPSSGRVSISVSDNGLLVYQEGGTEQGDELVLVDREGNELRKLGDPGSYYGPRFSPDGRKIALDISGETNRGDIWMLDVDRGSGTRLTFFEEDDTRPRWSPDGKRIVFSSAASGSDRFALWISDSRAGAQPQLLHADPVANLEPNDWAPGDFLLVHRETQNQQGLYVYSFADGEMTPWVETSYEAGSCSASPDGDFAAYVSFETGREEVWMQTFPSPGERFRVSVDGGRWPAWREDGNELFYVAPDDRLMAVPITWRDGNSGRAPEFGKPQPLFRVDSKQHTDRQFDTQDGQTFLLNRIVRTGAGDPLTLVQGWVP